MSKHGYVLRMDRWINNYFYVTLSLSIISFFLCRVVFHVFFFILPQFPPFVFDLSYFLCTAQTWKQRTRVLNGKGLFSRSLQIPNEIKKADYTHLILCPKSCSMCEGGRKPRAVQSNPGIKQLHITCLSKKVRRIRKKEILFFCVCVYFWELGKVTKLLGRGTGMPGAGWVWEIPSLNGMV